MSTQLSYLESKFQQTFTQFTNILFPEGISYDPQHQLLFGHALAEPIDAYADQRIIPLENRIVQLEQQVATLTIMVETLTNTIAQQSIINI